MTQRRYEEARPYFMRSLLFGEKFHDVRAVSSAANNLGFILWRLKLYDSALVYHSRALHLAEQTHDTLSIGISFINFGVCYQGKQEFTKALAYFREALSIHCRLGNARGEMLALYYTGWTLHDMKQHRQALPYLLAAVQMADSLKMHSPLQDAYNVLSETYTALGQHQKATEALRHYVAVKDSLYTATNAQQIAALQTQYDSEKKDSEISFLHQEHTQETTLLSKK